jgi:serine/threonine-protein kinase
MREDPERAAGGGDDTWGVDPNTSENPAVPGRESVPPTIAGDPKSPPVPKSGEGPAKGRKASSAGPSGAPAPAPAGDRPNPARQATEETLERPLDSSFSAESEAAKSTNPETEAFHGPAPQGWAASEMLVIEPGREVFGKYRLIRRIGSGAMGEVWQVEHLEMRDKRALKLIRPEISQNPQAKRRFRNEAMLMAKLKHPNAVVVHDYGWRGGHAYIEMEYLRGSSIDKVIEDGEPRPLDWTVQFLDQLCAVLQEAHGFVDEETNVAHPIVHRDLKPSNMMFVEGRPPGQNLKVLDFGIAKIIGEEEQATLATEGFVGTAAFASPEQINGEKSIDGRSDLYSVGVILYKLLTGRLPFEGRGFAVLHQHLKEKPPRMSEANPAVKLPRAVEDVVNRCLEKEPRNRPQSAQELRELFHQAMGNKIPAPSGPTPSPTPVPPKFTRLQLASLAGVLLLAVSLAAIFGRDMIGSRGGGTSLEKPPPSVVPPPDPGKVSNNPKPVPRPTPTVVALPEGYVRVDNTDRSPEGPLRLKRVEDGVVFERYQPGVYLPDGYEADPVPPDEKLKYDGGPWPQRIVRKADKSVRFLRIPGQVYFRGAPVDQGNRNPADLDPPHYVKVEGFYLQETEVTNGELEDYASRNGIDLPDSWKLYRGKLISSGLDESAVRQTAAGRVDHTFAEGYARSLNGRLPTDAEWEFAARSRGKPNLFAWNRNAPMPKAHIGADRDFPAEVKTMPDDKTEQGVFDMTGNVSEWCLDPYEHFQAILNAAGSAPNDLEHPLHDRPVKVERTRQDIDFVLRGGSFETSTGNSNNYVRTPCPGSSQSPSIGFRLMLECPPEVTQGKSPK